MHWRLFSLCVLKRGLLAVMMLAAATKFATPASAAPTTPEPAVASPDAIGQLAERRLVIPVQGIAAKDLIDTYVHPRDGGARLHEALDIVADRGTPVVAVEAGRIVKLFLSKAGGLTVYQFDNAEEYIYLYGHLDRYADDLTEGMRVKPGQIIGYVGSSGNANPATPHLHFAIFQADSEKRWWKGSPINPYPLLRNSASTVPPASD